MPSTCQIAGGGDRKGYRQDWRNAREAMREVAADIAQGADMVMVKPALAYLDVIHEVRRRVDVPLAAYHVSGEYAMVKAAAANGWIDHDAVALEHLTAIKRAGADLILTYFTRWFAERAGASMSHDVIPFCDSVACAAAGCKPDVCIGAGVAVERARVRRVPAVIPGGVNSSIRAFKAVGGRPYVVARAEGPHVWDVEGTPVHRPGAELRRRDPRPRPPGDHRRRHRRRRATARRTARPTPREMKLAEAIPERVPSASRCGS